MEEQFQKINTLFQHYYNDISNYDSYFECKSKENEEIRLKRIENFYNQSISIYQNGLHMISMLQQMITMIEEYNVQTLQRSNDVITIAIETLEVKKNRKILKENDSQKQKEIENDYIIKKSDWKNKKRDIKMKLKKEMLKETQIQQYQEMNEKINIMQSTVNTISTIQKSLTLQPKITNALVGTSRNNTFNIKRILVYQLQ